MVADSELAIGPSRAIRRDAGQIDRIAMGKARDRESERGGLRQDQRAWRVAEGQRLSGSNRSGKVGNSASGDAVGPGAAIDDADDVQCVAVACKHLAVIIECCSKYPRRTPEGRADNFRKPMVNVPPLPMHLLSNKDPLDERRAIARIRWMPSPNLRLTPHGRLVLEAAADAPALDERIVSRLSVAFARGSG